MVLHLLLLVVTLLYMFVRTQNCIPGTILYVVYFKNLKDSQLKNS